MPPGLIHAVFTPEDCIRIGGSCLTKGGLADSMYTADIQLGAPDLSNDDISPQMPIFGRLHSLADVPLLESMTMLKLPRCQSPPSVLEHILRSSPALEKLIYSYKAPGTELN